MFVPWGLWRWVEADAAALFAGWWGNQAIAETATNWYSWTAWSTISSVYVAIHKSPKREAIDSHLHIHTIQTAYSQSITMVNKLNINIWRNKNKGNPYLHFPNGQCASKPSTHMKNIVSNNRFLKFRNKLIMNVTIGAVRGTVLLKSLIWWPQPNDMSRGSQRQTGQSCRISTKRHAHFNQQCL